VRGVIYSSKTYTIKGVKYTPQLYYNYDKVGLASWYGPECHGKPKAQGEPYDQYAMTAAHKTLPLPTIVKVTNLANGKSAVVLVDDRGPYIEKRILDLSVSAAKMLGTYDSGVAKVRVQALCKESDALSMYLKENKGAMSKRQTWEHIYRSNIGARNGYQQLTTVPQSTNIRTFR
jgi:rare lipoprotein A